MTDAAAPAATATPATPQAAPPPLPKDTPSPGPSAGGEAASGAATPAPAAEETAEQRAAKVRAAGKAARRAAAQNRELQARLQQQGEQAAAAKAEAQQARAEAERLRQLAEKDKFAAARELGISAQELAERALKEGTPEWQAEQERRALREELDAIKRRDAEREEADRQAKVAQATRSAQEAFARTTADAATYPKLAALPEEVRVTWGMRLVEQERQRVEAQGLDWTRYSQKLTDSVLAAHMEKKLAGVPAAPAKAPDTASSPDAQPNGSATPQTVTSKLASAKYTLPANYDSLSDQEQKYHLARYLESLGGGKKKRTA